MKFLFSTIVSYRRIINVLSVVLAYCCSKIFREPFKTGLPLSLTIEPVNFCNLSCLQCPVGKGTLNRKSGKMLMDLYTKLIHQVKDHVSYLTLYFQGEPLLHPDVVDFIRIAKENRIYITTSTNAQILNDELAKELVESGLDKMTVSMDGTTQEIYEKYRVSGSLAKVEEGVCSLVKWKKMLKSSTPFIELQFLVLKHNEHQLPDIKSRAEELGVNRLTLKTAQIYDLEKAADLVPRQTKYARYQMNKQGVYVRKKKIRNSCWRAFSGAVITVDGEVLPCSNDKNGEHSFGNINQQSLAEIWHNEKAQRFRKQILTSKKVFDICRDCTM